MSESPRRSVRIALAVVLAIATLAAYAGTLRAGFVSFDDPEYVLENPHVATGLSFSNIAWALRSVHVMNWSPATWISHMLDVEIFGLEPAGHHATSVLLHVANSLLLLFFLDRATRAFFASFVVAALFALHPMHVESVAWIAERKDVLSTLFLLLSLLAWTSWIRLPKRSAYLAALGAFALGLAAKPMLVTLPFAMILLDHWPFGRLRRSRLSSLVVEKLPFFALAAASCLVTYTVQEAEGAVSSLTLLPSSIRISNALVSWVGYLVHAVWPVGLCVYYPHPFVVQTGLALGSFVLLALLTALALRERGRRPWILVGWLWYLGMLVPVIGIVQVGAQAMADRYSYVPLVGVFVAVVWSAHERLRDRTRTAIVLSVSILAALAFSTARLVESWKDSESLFRRALEMTERNGIAHFHLALAANGRGDTVGAAQRYVEALRVFPRYYDANKNLGRIYDSNGMHVEAEARFRLALKTLPGSAEVRTDLGRALVHQGRIEDGIAELRRALEIDPNRTDAHRDIGLALAGQGKLDEGVEHLRRAVEGNPNDFEAQGRLGAGLGAQGRLNEALVHLEKALDLRPGDPSMRRSVAFALVLQGRVDDAIVHYRRILESDPNDLDALNQVAWIRATHSDPARRDAVEAVLLAERARDHGLEASGVLFDTLAAAYAESGRFPEAVAACEKAIDLARASGDDDSARRFQEHLELLRAGKPLRIR